MTDIKYTKKMYDDFGKEYHEKRLIPSKNFWNEFIEIPAMESLLKKAVRNKKVLDLGCGSGIFTHKLKKYGADIVGYDLSKTLIDIAKIDYSDIEFCVGDAQKTHFKKNSFDIVCSSLMIHYIKDLDKLFFEISRILKKQGKFVFSFHHPFNEVIKKIKSGDKTEFMVTPYFQNNRYKWNMLERMEMISYHHTFENITQSLQKTGFVVELIIEPQPIKNSRKYDEKSYNRTMLYPSFCIIQAIKSR